VTQYVSPYHGLPVSDWLDKTKELLAAYPLTAEQIVAPVLEAWGSIFESRIGRHGIQIGKDIFPTPQIMASYLHELIPLEFAHLYPDAWRCDITADEKDLVYIPDNQFSTEIKTSSNPRSIFANRSYAQAPTTSKKSKNGYYIAVNFIGFEKGSKAHQRPGIRIIRFGWLDHTDWKGQKSPTGQQASLHTDSAANKLIVLYRG
jgi:hypothetical protein